MTLLKQKISLFFILALSYLQAFTQVEKFANTITSSDLKDHLYKIASAEMKGRETATEGQRTAAAYIEEQFKQYHLLPGWEGGYQQQFPVFRDSLVRASLNINGRELEFDSEFYVTSNSGFNIAFQSGEIVFAGLGRSDTSSDDYKNVNARGKVVVVWPKAADYYSLQRAAKKNGAEALLIVQSRFSKGNAPREARMYVRDYRQDSLPNTFVVSDKLLPVIFKDHLAGIDKAMKAGTDVSKSYPVPVKLEHAKITEHLQSSNVIGVMEGTDKKQQAVVLTAHYDHLGARDSVIYYGADDDGSGTVTVLEIAQAFSLAAGAGMKPRRTIIFMTVSGEEKGLWGSAYYSDHPAFPMDSTSANVNIDMIGRIEKGRKGDSLNYIYVVGDNRLSSDLRPISEGLNSKHHKLHFDYKYNSPDDPERIYYRSDHYNFAKKGVPAIFYFSGLHEDYHRPTDTPDKIRYDLLSHRAQTIFYTTWEIANRDEMLKRDLP
ncbi:MAG: M28 family peptidase [Chitinophagaceae bacterium]|nr:M28 family peptidase [Chitinophagaceae bacterium]